MKWKKQCNKVKQKGNRFVICFPCTFLLLLATFYFIANIPEPCCLHRHPAVSTPVTDPAESTPAVAKNTKHNRMEKFRSKYDRMREGEKEGDENDFVMIQAKASAAKSSQLSCFRCLRHRVKKRSHGEG